MGEPTDSTAPDPESSLLRRVVALEPLMLITLTVFWIIIASIIGGVILLRPLSKKLGNFLEEWVAIRRIEVENRGPDVEMLAHRLEALESGQIRLLESVTFHEELAESKDN